MRAIKFRGKTELTSEWVYGFYTMGSLVHVEHPEKDERIVPRYLIDDGLLHDVIPETIGQYTGLTDKNEKEIYEGDILDVHIPCNSIGKEEHRTRVVVWNEKYARFEFQNKKGDCIADSVGAKYNLVYYMVVGNIHDNPELLEKGDDK